MKRVLLTNVRPDLIEGGYVASLFDPFGERFTRGQGVFTLTGHLHALGTHMIAQNIRAHSVVLEYPTLEDFRKELRKGFDLIGISFWINHTDGALQLCRIAREESPSSKVVLGGHGVLNLEDAVPVEADRKALFDHVCPGEGVRFMRELLGEPADDPIRQGIFPRGGAGPPWLSANPPGMIPSILAGFGCEMACSFCASSRFWNYRHIRFTDANGIYKTVQRLYKIYPEIFSFLIVDEDFFRLKDVVGGLTELVRKDQSFGGLKNFSFMTETSIGALSQYDPDDILMSGLAYAFIGYESKFAADQGLRKRKGDAKEIFDNLRKRGINTNAAMMVGWDFQTPENLSEDLDYLISCQPTQSQFSRLIPYPGTVLWKQLKKEGRLDLSVPWKDYHNYGGPYQHKHFSPEQIHQFIEQAHIKAYEILGPSLFRMFQTYLNGYEHCLKSKHRALREDKSAHFRERLEAAYPIFKVCQTFAPNSLVRNMAVDAEKRLIDLLGAPSQDIRSFASDMIGLVEAYSAKKNDSRSLRTFPCKRYIYDGRPDELGRPFRVEYDLGGDGEVMSANLWRLV
jgi:radical SAM superfamily enzyme YgiQ (UPF0313 family)